MSRPKETRWWKQLRARAEIAGDTQQQEIAATLGVSPTAVSKWSQGGPPRPENVIAAAHAYNVDPRELLAIAFIDDEEPEKENPKAPRPKKPRPKIPLQPRQDMPPY